MRNGRLGVFVLLFFLETEESAGTLQMVVGRVARFSFSLRQFQSRFLYHLFRLFHYFAFLW